MHTLDRFAFILAMIAGGGTLAAGYGSLPAMVPSGFGPGGDVRGWMERDSFMAIQLVLVFGGPLALCVVASWIGRMPNHWINLPHRDYWLAPQRRDASLSALKSGLHRIAICLCLFFTTVFALHWQAAMQTPPALNSLAFAGALCAFLTAVILIVWAQVRRFPKPSASDLQAQRAKARSSKARQ